MNGSVIDTLRYSDRLKAAGFEPGQAEAMSRALNAELTEGLATKSDLEAATAALGSAIRELDAKFEGLSGQFANMSRHVFLVLALIASLGLYNAIAPLVVGKAPQQSGPSQSVPATVEQDESPAGG